MGVQEILFKCPHCQNFAEKTDARYDSERIQNSDDLNADPDREQIPLTLTELWYCFECGNYFKAYYKFQKIQKLKEQ